MNKGITILILFTLLGAMGLVFYSHTRQGASAEKEPGRSVTPASGEQLADSSPLGGGQAGGAGNPLQAPQGGNSGLKQIEPPLTSSRPGADGAPMPVKVTTGRSGPPAQTVQQQVAAPPAAVPSPSLLPGGSPAGPGTAAMGAAGQASNPDTAGRGTPAKPSVGSPELTPWGTPSAGAVPAAPAESARANGPERATAGAPQAAEPASQNRDNGKTSPASAPPVASAPSAASAPPVASAPSAASAPPVAAPPAASAPPAREPVLSDKDSHVLKDIHLQFAGQNMRLLVEADTPFPCRTFVLNNPDRLVIDLPGSWKGIKTPTVPQNRLVKAVRVGSQPAGPRLVLDLADSLKGHKMQRNGNVVEVLMQ